MEVPKYPAICKYFIDSNRVYGYCFLKSITISDKLDSSDCMNCYKFDDSDRSEYLQVQIDKRAKWLK